MPVLIDTSILLAYAFVKDEKHSSTSKLLHSLENEVRIVPLPVLVELFYLTTERIHYTRAIQIFAVTRTVFRIETLIADDLERMGEIMARYREAQFDFTDVAIMALTERLNITTVCTFDRRDFPIFRPKHTHSLTLLP